MAGNEFSPEQLQVWSYLSKLVDGSSSYNLYQRKYPRRLPKLDEYTSISFNTEKNSCLPSLFSQKSTHSSGEVVPIMPMSSVEKVFCKKESNDGSMMQRVEDISKNMVLEDFPDDEQVQYDELPNPISANMNNFITDINLESIQHNKSPTKKEIIKNGPGYVSCLEKNSKQSIISASTTSIRTGKVISPKFFQQTSVINTKKINNTLKKTHVSHPPLYSPQKSISPINLSLLMPRSLPSSPTKKVNTRSNSISVSSSNMGRNSSIDSKIRNPKRRSYSVNGPSPYGKGSNTNYLINSPHIGISGKDKETSGFLELLKSQKETNCIQSLMKSEKIKTMRRRHTYHSNLITEDLYSSDKKAPKTNDFSLDENNRSDTLNNLEKNFRFNELDLTDPVVIVSTVDQSNENIKIPEKNIDRFSSKYFFNHNLELDSQMKLLEDKTYEIHLEDIGGQKIKGEPISRQVALTLRLLLYGNTLSTFTASWKDQSISFIQNEHYGLQFHKDGPVEIMTSLQAFVLKHLLFENKEIEEFDPKLLAPSTFSQINILILSISDMIWKIGEREHAVVSFPIGKCQFIPDYCYRNDDVTEKMELFKFTKWDELKQFIKQNIQRFIRPNQYGCISFLYSLMLTRGLSNLFNDCCETKAGILEFNDAFGKSQCLINLCIYGRGVPNVFNKDVEVYNEIKDKIEILKGLHKRSEIGYLTHSEFSDKKNYEVGSCLKTPQYPIWILENSGTLGVLFSTKRNLLSDWRLEQRFDLYYYQGIAKHVPTFEIDIRVTMNTLETLIVKEDEEEEDRSTLEELLRTKWKDCVVEWNGYTKF